MKNMIAPEKLAELMEKPVSFERIAEFLLKDSTITATQLCKAVGVDSQQYFNWKSQRSKRAAQRTIAVEQSAVEPTGQVKKKYSAEEKMSLLNQFAKCEGEARSEFLRKFGLYQSDMDRWSALVHEAAIGALSTRKTRSDKKPQEQVELESMRKELRGQEKTIAKLAALVVIQKKVSEILGINLE
jgi:hypothetical protein